MTQNRPIRGAKFSWFRRDLAQDIEYLNHWRNVPLSYLAGQPTDGTFHTDHHEQVITPHCTPEMFARAADLLLRYEFYPPSLMLHVSDFSRENRTMRVGDRIIQRINGLALFNLTWPLVDGITMNEVIAVIDEPRRKGFTYVTTEAHAELGEWSAGIEWRADDSLLVTIDSFSRPAYHVSTRMHPYMRRGQLRAHHLGMDYFQAQVLASHP